MQIFLPKKAPSVKVKPHKMWWASLWCTSAVLSNGSKKQEESLLKTVCIDIHSPSHNYLHFCMYTANYTLEQNCRRGGEGLGKGRAGNRRKGEGDSEEVPAEDKQGQLGSTRKREQPRSSGREVRTSLTWLNLTEAGAVLATAAESKVAQVTTSLKSWKDCWSHPVQAWAGCPAKPVSAHNKMGQIYLSPWLLVLAGSWKKPRAEREGKSETRYHKCQISSELKPSWKGENEE